jgi:hypothetical protein
MLAGLASRKTGTAYVIVCCPSTDERDWWMGRLNATHVRIESDLATCKGRLGPERHDAVSLWHRQAKSNTWVKPMKRGANENGSPLDPDHHWNRE